MRPQSRQQAVGIRPYIVNHEGARPRHGGSGATRQSERGGENKATIGQTKQPMREPPKVKDDSNALVNYTPGGTWAVENSWQRWKSS